MPTKTKPLPTLPARCPLCKKLLREFVCICGGVIVECYCTRGFHKIGTRDRTARKSWFARIAAKRKAAKGKR